MTTDRRLRIAVMLTSHNRASHTLTCLAALQTQTLRSLHDLDVLLVEDGSTDGTAERVEREFPEVRMIRGDGTLYWAGGMRTAFGLALQEAFDYFVWINDDTSVHADALERLVRLARTLENERGRPVIVAGATRDQASGHTSYSGWVRAKHGPLRRLARLEPQERPQRCDTFNGNCVVISAAAARRVGNLDSTFMHSMADFDYGFRAVDAGCEVWLAPGFIGTCRENKGAGLWTDRSVGLATRWRRMLGPKGLPTHEWRTFTARHYGPLWPLYWLNPYVKFWLRGALSLLTRGGRQ